MSEAANDTVWVGIDTPLAPQAFSVVDNGDGTAVATWQAVGDTGANGGYVNTNDVTYTIYDANGSLIATDIYDTSFTITGLNSQQPQVVTSFAVAAKNVAGESLKTNSDEVLVGPSLAIPFSESFAQAEYANTPWTTKTLAGKSYNGLCVLTPTTTTMAQVPTSKDMRRIHARDFKVLKSTSALPRDRFLLSLQTFPLVEL